MIRATLYSGGESGGIEIERRTDMNSSGGEEAKFDEMIKEGLVTLEKVRVIAYRCEGPKK